MSSFFRRRLALALSTGTVVGFAWAFLYWISFGQSLLLASVHVAVAMASTAWVARHPTTWRDSALPGGVIGCLWLAPMTLYLLDITVYQFSVRLVDVSLAMLVVVGGWLIGLYAGSPKRLLPRLLALALLTAGAPLAATVVIADRPATFVDAVDRSSRAPSPPIEGAGRVMILGIDGAGWDAVLPMVHAGRLPNLAGVMQKGQYGVLTSVRSPSGATISPTVWASILTGTTPEKHGLLEWETSDSRNRRRKALWTIFNDYGRKSLVVNVPGSFPAEVVEGLMVSGFPLPGVVKPASEQFFSVNGSFYTSRSDRRLETLPTRPLKLAEIAPAEHFPPSFSPVLKGELPLLANIDTRHEALGYRAHRSGLRNLFLESLVKRGFPGPRHIDQLLIIVTDSTDDGARNYDRATLYRGTHQSQPIANLKPIEWSDWMHVRVKGAELVWRLKLVELDEKGISFYITPLFQSSVEPVIRLSYPPEASATLTSPNGEPYIVEGAGWFIHDDTILLETLYEHTIDVAAVRASAAGALLERHPSWGLFVFVFTESDRVQHPFWRFHRPRDYPVEDVDLLRKHEEKVSDVFERIDTELGKLLVHADETTTVAIVSDHGFGSATSGSHGDHTLDGLYVLAGPHVRPSGSPLPANTEALGRASALSVTPTLLFLAGYPVARDLDGDVLTETATSSYLARNPVKFVDSFEASSTSPNVTTPLDPSTMEQLRSLGYVR